MGDDEEDCDPNISVIKATKQAQEDIKNAQREANRLAKEQKRAAAQQPKEEQTAEDTQRTQRRDNRPRGEPRGNQQARRGRRNQQFRDGERAEGGNNDDHTDKALAEDNNRPRRNDRRGNDRRSGSNRTGVKAVEKRQGGGGRNWGRQDEIPEKLEEEKNSEEPTEAAPADENAEEAAPEEQENKEPEVVELTMEEYMQQLNMNQSETPVNVRQANDGKSLSGNRYQAKKVHVDQPMYSYNKVERTNDKVYMQGNFKSGTRQGGRRDNYFYDGPGAGAGREGGRGRGGRGGGRGRGGRGAGRGGGNNSARDAAPTSFNLAEVEDNFPALGKN